LTRFLPNKMPPRARFSITATDAGATGAALNDEMLKSLQAKIVLSQGGKTWSLSLRQALAIAVDADSPEAVTAWKRLLTSVPQPDYNDYSNFALVPHVSVKEGSFGGFGRSMVALNRACGVTTLGGCCGTGVAHLRYITNDWV
jgi:hypothetical protein